MPGILDFINDKRTIVKVTKDLTMLQKIGHFKNFLSASLQRSSQ